MAVSRKHAILGVVLGLALLEPISPAVADPFAWAIGSGHVEMTGEALYKSRCGGCHALDHNKYGPSHRDLYGRRAATQPGYHYSDALSRSGIVWNDTSLDQWLADPRRVAPGTKMDAKVGDPSERRRIIEYLKGDPR